MKELVSIAEASRLLSVHQNTLRSWDSKNKFSLIKSKGGHRRYLLKEIETYLDEKDIPDCLKEPFEIREQYDSNELLSKWNDHLAECETKNERINLSILLENCEKTESLQFTNKIFTLDQVLWLTKHGWLKSKFRKLVSVQASLGPATTVSVQDEKSKIRKEIVSVHGGNYIFRFFEKAKFESIKDVYTQLIANGIDDYIIKILRKKQINNIYDFLYAKIELKPVFDWIILSKSKAEKVIESGLANGVDIFVSDDIVSLDASLNMSFGGKYPVNNVESPVFVPYVIFNYTPGFIQGTFGTNYRVGYLI